MRNFLPFKTESMFRDVTVLTLGTGLAQLINIGSAPLLSRLYSPKDFGILAIFLAIVGISSTLVTLRYETAILIPKSSSESANIVITSILLALSISGLLILMSVIFNDRILQMLGVVKIKEWIHVVFVVSGLTAITVTIQNWLNREKRYVAIVIIRIAQSTFTVVFAITFYYLNQEDLGLIGSQNLSLILTFTIASCFIFNLKRKFDLKKIPLVLYDYRNAPKFLLPTAILDVISLQLPILMMANLFGEEMGGQFSMSWRVLAIPLSLVGMSVGQVFLQRFSLLKDDPKSAKDLLQKTWILLFIVGTVPTLTIFSGGKEIFQLIFGEEWLTAGVIASILSPMALIIFVSSPTSGAYIILGMQKYSLIFGVLTTIYRPFCLLYGYFMEDLFTGLKIWVMLEIIVIIFYQYLAWQKLKDSCINN